MKYIIFENDPKKSFPVLKEEWLNENSFNLPKLKLIYYDNIERLLKECCLSFYFSQQSEIIDIYDKTKNENILS